MARIIGNIIFHLKKIFIETFGEDEFARVLDNVAPETKKLFGGHVISSEWYELRDYQDFLKGIVAVIGKENLIKVKKELGTKQLSGIFGFLIKFVTMNQVLKQSPKMWRRIFDVGDFEVTGFTDKGLILTVKNFEFSEENLIGTSAYIQSILEIVMKSKLKCNYERIDKKTTKFEYFFDPEEN